MARKRTVISTRPTKERTISFKLTESQRTRLVEEAHRAEMNLSEFILSRIFRGKKQR